MIKVIAIEVGVHAEQTSKDSTNSVSDVLGKWYTFIRTSVHTKVRQ